MVSKLSSVKDIVLEMLSDGNEYTSDEIRDCIDKKGIKIDKESSTLRTAIYQLRNNGVEIYSRERGIYQIKQNKDEYYSVLKDFTTLMPEEKSNPKYLYIHTDGNIVLNRKLNKEIVSRQIEIRINDNGRKLALIPNGENYHKFTKSGVAKNTAIIKKLRNKRISIPAAYEMSLDKSLGIWIGEICKSTKNKIKE